MATTATTLTGELEQPFLRRGDRRRRRRYDGLGSDEATKGGIATTTKQSCDRLGTTRRHTGVVVWCWCCLLSRGTA